MRFEWKKPSPLEKRRLGQKKPLNLEHSNCSASETIKNFFTFFSLLFHQKLLFSKSLLQNSISDHHVLGFHPNR